MAKKKDVISKVDEKDSKKELKNKKKVNKEKKSGYLKEVRLELKKVTFPKFKNVIKYTFVGY